VAYGFLLIWVEGSEANMYIRMRPNTCDVALQLAFLLVGALMGAIFWSWRGCSWWTLAWQAGLAYLAVALVYTAQVSFCFWVENVEKRSPQYSSMYSKLYSLRGIYGVLSCCLLICLYTEFGQKADFIALVTLTNWTLGNYAASLILEKTPAPFVLDPLGRAL